MKKPTEKWTLTLKLENDEGVTELRLEDIPRSKLIESAELRTLLETHERFIPKPLTLAEYRASQSEPVE